MKAIPLTPVSSSQIAALGHDAASSTLAIQFKSKAAPVYHYNNVPASEYEKLLSAESIGSYFGKNIKGATDKYPCARVADNNDTK